MRKESLTYKVHHIDSDDAHYTHDKDEAYEIYNKFVNDYGNAVRLYEAPMPINDHDEIMWEVLEYFDMEEED